VKEITDGEVALVLVLGLMSELAQSGALIPVQLNEVMRRCLDIMGRAPEQAARRRRLQSFQKKWNPGKPRAVIARSRHRDSSSKAARRAEAHGE
jgi:hypothetical protein